MKIRVIVWNKLHEKKFLEREIRHCDDFRFDFDGMTRSLMCLYSGLSPIIEYQVTAL